MSKLTPVQIEEIKERYYKGFSSIREIAADYSVSRSTINRILNPQYADREREAHRERLKNNRKNYPTKRYRLELHLINDNDLIEKLDSVKNRQGYIKDLIRKDIQQRSSK